MAQNKNGLASSSPYFLIPLMLDQVLVLLVAHSN